MRAGTCVSFIILSTALKIAHGRHSKNLLNEEMGEFKFKKVFPHFHESVVTAYVQLSYTNLSLTVRELFLNYSETHNNEPIL